MEPEAIALPVPGDLLVARRPMRAWEADDYHGLFGQVIQPGEQGLLVAVWTVGSKLRLKVLRRSRVMLFSCRVHTVLLNWTVISTTHGEAPDYSGVTPGAA